jgi:hypothetical protein
MRKSSGKLALSPEEYETVLFATKKGQRVNLIAVDFSEQTLGSTVIHAGNIDSIEHRYKTDEYGDYRKFYLVSYLQKCQQ